jgi:hypothetical protein
MDPSRNEPRSPRSNKVVTISTPHNIIFSSPHKIDHKKIVEFHHEEQEEGCVFHNWKLT